MLLTARQVAFQTNKTSFGTLVSMYLTLNGAGLAEFLYVTFLTASDIRLGDRDQQRP